MTDKFTPEPGLPTLYLRAENWECDFNNHWNTRYYCRAFQTAAEVAAAVDGVADPDAAGVGRRHIRFHAEVLGGDALQIRSFDLAEGAGRAHLMTRDGALVATALDEAPLRGAPLPPLPADRHAPVLPRGLVGPPPAPWRAESGDAGLIQLGPAREGELHRDGHLTFEASVDRLLPSSHEHDTRLGFTGDFTRRTGIGRMLVEMRWQRLGPCSPGRITHAASRLVAAGGKSYVTAHLLETSRGAPLAMAELCLVAVDMTTRRATDLPDFVVAATG